MRRGLAFVVVLVPACSLLTPLGDYASEDAPLGDGGASETAAPEGSTRETSTPSPYRDAVMADGPLLYLRFGDTNTTVVHDETGRADGSYSLGGVTLGTPGALLGDPDTAVTLDGTGRITLPPGAEFAGISSFTVELWVKVTTVVPLTFLVDHQRWDGGRRGWLLITGDAIGMERYADPNTNQSNSFLWTEDFAWHHLVTVYDVDRHRIYLDALQKVAGGPGTVSIPAISIPWSIGRQNCSCSGNALIGAVDELAVYDKVLTEGRILAHYRASGR